MNGFLVPILSMRIPIRGLKRATKSEWVVMMSPAEAGPTPRPSLTRFTIGDSVEPAMTVRVAEARIIDKVGLLGTLIIVDGFTWVGTSYRLYYTTYTRFNALESSHLEDRKVPLWYIKVTH